MAVYDPPQPLWKRNLAGILDFVLAFLGFSFLFLELGLARIVPPPAGPLQSGTVMAPVAINFQPGPGVLLLGLIIGYFVVLGRTGGTVFQRLFGMKRADIAVWDPPQSLRKRILVGTLDFLLALIGFGLLSGSFSIEIIGTSERPLMRLGYHLTAWPTLLLLVLIVAYFVLLGRSGGTVFQRLFRMKRITAAVPNQDGEPPHAGHGSGEQEPPLQPAQ